MKAAWLSETSVTFHIQVEVFQGGDTDVLQLLFLLIYGK
jgi:hypothetical protein